MNKSLNIDKVTNWIDSKLSMLPNWLNILYALHTLTQLCHV